MPGRADEVTINLVSDRRLIEEILPIGPVSVEAVSEKLVRQGHISTLHAWWARRPLVACRAVILGALLRVPQLVKERNELLEFLETFCTWAASTDVKRIERARRLILSQNDGRPPRVLDCFAGGGAIPLEALRMGCETYALELNPVAAVIELCTLVYPQRYGKSLEVRAPQKGLGQDMVIENRLARDVDRWGRWVLEEARKELGRFYPDDSDGYNPIAYLWARTVECPNPKCGAPIPLVRQLLLANRPGKRISLRILPDRSAKRVRFDVVGDSEIDFDPKQGTMRAGTVRCPVCGHAEKGRFLQKEAMSGRMDQQLMVVVRARKGETGKRYTLPTTRDEDAFESARLALKNSKKLLDSIEGLPDEPLFTPQCKSPKGTAEPYFVQFQVKNYGMSNFGQLFNARQALALAVFCSKAREAHRRILDECHDDDYARAVASYLGLAVDKLADYNSSLCLWVNSRENQSNTFTRQALQMVWDYSESNPLSKSTGSWSSALHMICGVIEHCSSVGLGLSADVRQGTVTSLPYSDGYFDSIVTDPPYYDNVVSYAALSDFFYVWLKRTVGHLYPDLFTTPLTPKTPEIVQDDSHLRRAHGEDCRNIKDREFFDREMSRAFVEMSRVLKQDGICVVVFAHKTTTAWETLINALSQAGFVVSASWPLHTERVTRILAQGSAALASSVWLVCRKRNPMAPVGSWKQVQADLEVRVHERLDVFLPPKGNITGADALLSAIGPALEVFGRFSRVEKVTGQPVTVGEFLDKVTEVVSRHALAAVLEGQEMGTIDPPTAFYVLWKWSFEGRDLLIPMQSARTGGEEGDNEQGSNEEVEGKNQASRSRTRTEIRIRADDAFKLARSVGAEFDELIRSGGILRKQKEFVQLLAPEDRRATKDLGERARNGRPPNLIDILHRALNYWATGDQRALDEFLDISGAGSNETLWRIAGALSRILPLESSEKRLIDGLWGRYGRGGSTGSITEKGGKAQTRLEGFGRRS